MSADVAGPLLEASALRVAVDGAIALEKLDLTTTGSRLVLVGDVAPLVALLSNVSLGAASFAHSVEVSASEGLATVASGTLRLLGHDVATGAHLPWIGAAPLDPPMPLDWTALDYVSWSGELAGLGRSAKSQALEALTRVGLGRGAKRLLRTLSLPERRALVLAHAVVAQPSGIIAETPLAHLEGAEAAFVLAALNAVIEGRSAIVSLTRMSVGTPEGELGAASSDFAFVSRGELVLSGAPLAVASKQRLYGLTVRSNADALRAELSMRGIELRGGPLRFSAALPEGRDTRDILKAASVARSAVVELLALM